MVTLQNQTIVSNICSHILCNYIHTPEMASVSKLVKFENLQGNEYDGWQRVLALYFVHVQAFSWILFSGIIHKDEELSWVPPGYFFLTHIENIYFSLVPARAGRCCSGPLAVLQSGNWGVRGCLCDVKKQLGAAGGARCLLTRCAPLMFTVRLTCLLVSHLLCVLFACLLRDWVNANK